MKHLVRIAQNLLYNALWAREMAQLAKCLVNINQGLVPFPAEHKPVKGKMTTISGLRS